MTQQAMESCDNFNECSANICPEDEDIAKRTWFIGEDSCIRKDFRKLGFIRRQKKLNKKRPPSFMDHLFSYQELVDTAPVKRVLSPEAKLRLVTRLKQYQFEKKPVP
jgi:hypothetical protein